MAALQEVGEPLRRLVALPGAHEDVEVRLDPSPAIRSLAPVEKLLAPLERPQQFEGGNDPIREQLKPPARDDMLRETCEPLAFGLRLLPGAADVVTDASAARSRTAGRLQNLTDPEGLVAMVTAGSRTKGQHLWPSDELNGDEAVSAGT
jgi:hypothetical protein